MTESFNPGTEHQRSADIKSEVRQFYDQVGWSLVGEDLYQNARYEDLRPVSREYIHRCHLRVSRKLAATGEYLLDAGSGPIQYPEYLTYSQNYRYRVCADISITALKEARKRMETLAGRDYPEGKDRRGSKGLPSMKTPGTEGLYVVADIANLPFKSGIFDGIVSLHTIHHLPEHEHLQAFQGLHRLLAPGRSAVIVNGWPSSPLMERFEPLVRLSNRLRSLFNRLSGRRPCQDKSKQTNGSAIQTNGSAIQTNGSAIQTNGSAIQTNGGKEQRAGRVLPHGSTLPHGNDLRSDQPSTAKGTFTTRHDVDWMKNVVGAKIPVEILVWRSASVRFMRAVIYPWLAGRYWLRLLYWLEERNPHYYGENGQYPLIVIRKS